MAFFRNLALLLILSLSSCCLADESLAEKIDRMMQMQEHNDPDLLHPEDEASIPQEDKALVPAQSNPEAEKPKDRVKQVLSLSSEVIGLISAGSSAAVAIGVAVLRCCLKWRREGAEGARVGLADLWAVFLAVCFDRARPRQRIIALPGP